MPYDAAVGDQPRTSGATADAQTLLRSAFETLFCLCAIKEGEDVVEKLIEADIAHKKKTARELSNFSGDLAFDAGELAKLTAYIDQHPDRYDGVQFYSIASAAKLGEVYTVYYRSLSFDAAHPTLGSLERHARKDENAIYGFAYGPDVPDVAKTLAYAAVVALYLLKITAEVFGIVNLDSSLTAIWPRYLSLSGETFPNSKGEVA